MLGRIYLYSMIYLYKHTQKRKNKNKITTQRTTNLKRGRSERVSWGEAEKKSTVTFTLLQRRKQGQDNSFLHLFTHTNITTHVDMTK